jgi:hypothetical protein
MLNVDPNAPLSILGTVIHLNRVDGRTLMLRAPLRLCPGRVVPVRTGKTTFRVMVVNATVCALDPREGAVYELQVEMTGDEHQKQIRESGSRPASPAVGANASKKGGEPRAA